MSESFRAADGRTLAYELSGSGPTLVCHPGGPGFSSRYFGDFAGLGDRFTLAAKIDQCEREEGTYGAVEFVAGGVKLRS